MSVSTAGRRIVAVVLPELLSELAMESFLSSSRANHGASKLPLAVILDAEGDRLAAVNRVARRFGVSVGQTVVEAKAFLSQLVVHSVSLAQVQTALARIAEVAMSYARLVSVESEVQDTRSAPDTIWLDITGAAHLRGGEQELAEELAEQVRALGHEVRIAVASGKLLAQAFARWALPQQGQSVQLVPAEQTRAHLAELPVIALPLAAERTAWLVRLGLLSVGDIMALPRSAALSRLGPGAEQVLALCLGEDNAPLLPYQPTRQLVEERTWDQPVTGVEPLSFVLRGLASRLSARLAGRGEAAQSFKLTIELDRSIAELREVPPRIELCFDLASPLWKERDLLRVVRSRVERLTLGAPSVGVCWWVPCITRAPERQLDLARALGGTFSGGHEELPIVLAELNAELGKNKLGILTLREAHRPEARSILLPALARTKTKSTATRWKKRTRKSGQDRQYQQISLDAAREPQTPRLRKAMPSDEAGGTSTVFEKPADGVTPQSQVSKASRGQVSKAKAHPLASAPGMPPSRFLTVPIRFRAPLKPGASVSLGTQLYTVESLNFECRLTAVEWWEQPVNRDYFRVLLRGARSVFEALVFVERDSGQRYLQAIFD